MKDNLGNRMKKNYEDRFRIYLPRRTYTIIRLDGKSFHNFTKKLEKPFDKNFIELMGETTKYLCEEIQGSFLGYTQSDEISILLYDFENITTDAWFGGNIQKIVSVSASLATGFFNSQMIRNYLPFGKIALFDSRVFCIPDPTEVENYLIWRQKDAMRNSVSMLAQSLYSHKELHEKSQEDMKLMCIRKGINWGGLDLKLKRGQICSKRQEENWEIEGCFDFIVEREILSTLIPKYS